DPMVFVDRRFELLRSTAATVPEAVWGISTAISEGLDQGSSPVRVHKWSTVTDQPQAHTDRNPREPMSSLSVATDRVAGSLPATHKAPVPLEEVFYVSTHRRGSLVRCLSCCTRPVSRPGRVSHQAHRHPRG